jgi:hypothetical protein
MNQQQCGPNEVHRHLEVQAALRHAVEINSWETAMYEAMAVSTWFWCGGHRNIAI